MNERKEPSIWRLTKLASSSGEDRLTEALALTLLVEKLEMRFVQNILGDTELEFGTGDPPLRLIPQRKVGSSGRRIDLALESSTEAIWIEVKVDSGLSGDDQLEHYLSELKEIKADRKALVFLTRPGAGDAEVERLKLLDLCFDGVEIRAYDWLAVANWLAEVSKSQEGEADSMSASLRNYLRLEGVIVDPVTETDVAAMRQVELIRDSWWTLFEGVRNELSKQWDHSAGLRRPGKRTWDGPLEFHMNFMPRGELSDWPMDRSGLAMWLELRGIPGSDGDYEFRAGLTLVDNSEKLIQTKVNEPRVNEVCDQKGLESDYDQDNRLLRIEKVKSLSEIAGSDITGQITDLVEWTSQIFSDVSTQGFTVGLWIPESSP